MTSSLDYGKIVGMKTEQIKNEANRLLQVAGKHVRLGDFVNADIFGLYELHAFRQKNRPVSKRLLVAIEHWPNTRTKRIMRIMQCTVGHKYYLLPGNNPSSGVKTIMEVAPEDTVQHPIF